MCENILAVLTIMAAFLWLMTASGAVADYILPRVSVVRDYLSTLPLWDAEC